MLTINVVTLFPEMFGGALGASILGRAAQLGHARYRVVQLRDYTHDRHRTVDDSPYGGGAGMVLKPEPFFEAVDDLRAGPPIVLLSARGRAFTHQDAVRFSVGRELTLLCGHYKDVDQRVADGLGAEELSLGDFVLSGGEPAALCVIDAVVRLLPGALGDHESAATDSHYDGGRSSGKGCGRTSPRSTRATRCGSWCACARVTRSGCRRSRACASPAAAPASTRPSPCGRSQRASGWSASSRCTRRRLRGSS